MECQKVLSCGDVSRDVGLITIRFGLQIQKVVIALGDYMNATCHACIGGTNVREDLMKLNNGVHVVVGTPGRVHDMISRKALNPTHIKMFVLDEADEMLSRGFKDQIYNVFKFMPSDIQVVLLSATMPVDVLEVTKKFMRNPIRILVKKEELTLEGKTFLSQEFCCLQALCAEYNPLPTSIKILILSGVCV